MKIRLLAVGTGMPAWVKTGYEDYAKRLRGDLTLELLEIPAGHRGKSSDLRRLIDREGQAQLDARRPGERLLTLDLRGKPYTTEQLAQALSEWMRQGQNLCLAIGGPEGLSEKVRDTAEGSWALSPLTLPHPLVRVIVAEQIYRAWTLLHGHPYHR